MATPKEIFYAKRGAQLVKNLQSRHFEAYYCATKEEALAKALELIPEGSTVGWGGTMTATDMGLLNALRTGNYKAIDRDKCATMEEREQVQREVFFADAFVTGANALSLDGQMVNIDGTGNRVAPIIYGPKSVIVVAGMNKVEDTLADAMTRARTIAAPMNKQRFEMLQTPCAVTGSCADCKSVQSICNQIVITRNGRPEGRIKFVIIGEDMGF